MTYYEILQVSENASDEIIRASYKTLIKKYHPDVFEGDHKYAEEKTKQINEAYNTLSDPQKRKEYDSFLNANKAADLKTNVNNKIARTPKLLTSVLIIAFLLFVAFSQAAHPYIESTDILLQDNALLFGLRDFALLTCIMSTIPVLFVFFKADLTIKQIRTICGLNSSIIFACSLLLYIFSITPTMSIGWIAALIYYFINVQILRQISNCTPSQLKTSKIIILATIIAFFAIFLIGTAAANSIISPKTSSPNNATSTITYETYYVNVRNMTISPTNRDSDHSWDDAKLSAEIILNRWRRGEATEESMADIMHQFGSYPNDGDLVSIERGDYVEEVDDWCFDRNRKSGDVAIIENVYGYTIVYFVGAYPY